MWRWEEHGKCRALLERTSPHFCFPSSVQQLQQRLWSGHSLLHCQASPTTGSQQQPSALGWRPWHPPCPTKSAQIWSRTPSPLEKKGEASRTFHLGTSRAFSTLFDCHPSLSPAPLPPLLTGISENRQPPQYRLSCGVTREKILGKKHKGDYSTSKQVAGSRLPSDFYILEMRDEEKEAKIDHSAVYHLQRRDGWGSQIWVVEGQPSERSKRIERKGDQVPLLTNGKAMCSRTSTARREREDSQR